MGMAPGEVQALMLEALGQQAEGFTRKDLRETYHDMGVAPEKVDALVHATFRLPGIRRLRRGLYGLPANWRRNVVHRSWRITPRRLDVHDAVSLRDILYRNHQALTPGLDRLLDQLHHAVKGLSE